MPRRINTLKYFIAEKISVGAIFTIIALLRLLSSLIQEEVPNKEEIIFDGSNSTVEEHLEDSFDFGDGMNTGWVKESTVD